KEGQVDRKRAAGPVAVKPDLAAVSFGDPPADGEAESRPSGARRARRVDAMEAFEDEFAVWSGYARAGVAHEQVDAVATRPPAKRHVASVRVFDRVVREVEEQLQQQILITHKVRV